MFAKTSRYYKLPEVTTLDSQSRLLKSKTLRPLPATSGNFFHGLVEVDRLDHLAYQYYKQPKKWWRICDANPDFMAPQALLGKEPLITQRFHLIYGENQEVWKLHKQLIETVGVENVQILEEVQFEVSPTTVEESYTWAVMITFNQMNTNTEKLEKLIESTGFRIKEVNQLKQIASIGRIGKSIVIPPDSIK